MGYGLWLGFASRCHGFLHLSEPPLPQPEPKVTRWLVLQDSGEDELENLGERV